LISIAVILVPGSIQAQTTFTGSGLGAIPDGGPNGPGDWGAPLQVSFNVSGLGGSVSDLSLSITMRHGFSGDLETVLIPPASSGANPFVIFSRPAQSAVDGSAGSPAQFSADPAGNTPGTYTFSDSASGNLWSAAGFDTSTGAADFSQVANLPPGAYRTSVAGPWDAVGNPNGGNHNAGQFTSFLLDSGFVGLTPQQASGTWILQFRDGLLEDTGVVTDAGLTITTVPEPSAVLLMGLAGTLLGTFRQRRLA
jgi:PEP-CTERM motif